MMQRHDLRTVALAAILPMAAFAQAPAQNDAQTAFEAQLPAYRRAAPDEVLVRLRQRVTALVSPLPGFDPGSRMVDLVVEQTWPTAPSS
ncbi:MAG TPA: hypothetical protein VGN83_25445 [Falsiroseomonas sp.]|jgi:hypothetical protein|nr:hypothetical protein [Falsiroseomonas sp.]